MRYWRLETKSIVLKARSTILGILGISKTGLSAQLFKWQLSCTHLLKEQYYFVSLIFMQNLGINPRFGTGRIFTHFGDRGEGDVRTKSDGETNQG